MKKKHSPTHEALGTQANYRLLEALSESESRYQQLISQLNEIVFTIDADGLFTFINPAWQLHTGFTPDETLGQLIYHFIHPEDLPLCNQCLQNESSSLFEARFFDKQGHILWFEACLKPIFQQNQLKEVFGTFIDVTRRVKATEDLRASKERFMLAATATNDGIWDWNLQTDEVYFSPRWKEMLGYSDAELENSYSTWYNLIHPDDVKETISSLMVCLEGDNSLYESVHRLRNKSGSWSWILDRGIVLRDANGQGLRMAGSHADITPLKRIEEKLLQRERELNSIFSTSPDGIVTLTPEGRVSSVNPTFLEMTGFSRDELMLIAEHDFTEKMRSISTDDMPYEIDREQAFTLCQIVPVKNADTAKGEIYCQENSNNVRVLKLTPCQLNNETISKVIYFRDVTIETEIDRMKSEFLSTAAHELRTPMSSVFGFTELLLIREFDKETTEEILQNIHLQSASLVRMINDLLDLARIEARTGKEFHFSEQTLETIVKQTCNEFMMQGDSRIIKSIYPKAKKHLVHIDVDQFKRALTNIISNAFKYSPEGGEISIDIQQRQQTDGYDEVGVLVKDQGIGMTEEQVSHIFERFWRGSNTQHITGTGLGMSLVKEIMSFHHGQIEINSQLDEGTEVRLWLKDHSHRGE